MKEDSIERVRIINLLVDEGLDPATIKALSADQRKFQSVYEWLVNGFLRMIRRCAKPKSPQPNLSTIAQNILDKTEAESATYLDQLNQQYIAEKHQELSSKEGLIKTTQDAIKASLEDEINTFDTAITEETSEELNKYGIKVDRLGKVKSNISETSVDPYELTACKLLFIKRRLESELAALQLEEITRHRKPDNAPPLPLRNESMTKIQQINSKLSDINQFLKLKHESVEAISAVED